MKLFKKTLIINVLITLTILVHISICDEPVIETGKETHTAYPNLNEPPTSAEYLEKANFTSPLMSKSLKEQIPHRRLRRSDFLEFFPFSSYQLTRGEAEQIFVFLDTNKDNLIDNIEWGSFVNLFILPFEACMKGSYLLELEDFKLCWDKDPKTHDIAFRRE